ncbi:hypothetical protein G6F35_012689 [Rhizopus arrhizus]|nr:hypothetical protein G6F35_012689 [Rhizopus arrhizus]
MVHPIVGVAGKARQAIRPGAVLGQRAGEVTRHLPAAIAAGIQVQLAQRVGRGAFADGVDHTARTQLPIQHRRRAAQHFHPFQPIRFLPAVVDAGLQFQAVAQLPGVPRGHIETAQHQVVHHAAEGRRLRRYARRVAQRVCHRPCLDRADLIAGDDRHGLRGFDQRRVRLGARQRALRHVAVHMPGRRFDGTGHADRLKQRRTLRGAARTQRAIGGDGQFQAAAGKRAARRVFDREIPGDGRRSAPRHQGGIDGHRAPALACDAGQRIAQGACGQIEAQHGAGGGGTTLLGLGMDRGHGQGDEQRGG